MTAKDILLAVIIPLALAEFGPWCGWLAARILPLAAKLRYGDTERGAVRLEEWSGDLNDIPGQLTKLAYAVGQLAAGSVVSARRKTSRGRAHELASGEVRSALSRNLEKVARTGRWDHSRYVGRSEARLAVLTAAAARGWQLADVQAAVTSGTWPGLARLYGRRSEPGRMDRLLRYEWQKCIDRLKDVHHQGPKTVQG